MDKLEELFPDLHQEEARAHTEDTLPHHLRTPQPSMPDQKQNVLPENPRRRGWLLGGTIGIVVLLFGGTAYGIWSGWIPMPGFFSRLGGGKVFAESIEQLFALQSARYEIDLAVNVGARDADATPINFDAIVDAQQRIDEEQANTNTNSGQSSWLRPATAHAQSTPFSIENIGTEEGLGNVSEPESNWDGFYSFIPDNLNVDIALNGIYQRSQNDANIPNAEFGVTANVTFNEFDESFGGQTKIIAGDFFAFLSSLPGITEQYVGEELNLEPLLNTWIKLGKDSMIADALGLGDPQTSTPGSPDTEENNAIQTAQAVAAALVEQNLFTIRQSFSDEKIGTIDAQHIRVGIDPENVAEAYRAAVDAINRVNPDNTVPFDDTTFALYDSPEFKTFYTSVEQNSYTDLWLSRETKMPVKLLDWMRFIPASTDIFQEKQLVLQFSLTLTDVNTPITVAPPENPKDVDTLAKDVFGLTDEDLTALVQVGRVSRIRGAITKYAFTGYDYQNGAELRYPATLDVLVPDQLTEIPEDIYTGAPFVYRAVEDGEYGSPDYELEYQGPPSLERIQNVPLISFFPSAYQIDQIRAGEKNTATAYRFSKEGSANPAPSITTPTTATQNAQQLSNIAQLYTALLLYHDDTGNYPYYLADLTPDYLSEPLLDVFANSNYTYVRYTSWQGFSLQYALAGTEGEPLGEFKGYVGGPNTMTELGIYSLEGGWGATSDSSGAFADTDGDKLHDDTEAVYNTDPLKTDSDGDGFDDYTEIVKGYNPAGSGTL